MTCPVGSSITICCSDGGPCDEPLTDRQVENEWTIDRFQASNLIEPTDCVNEPLPPNTNRVRCRGTVGEREILAICSWAHRN